MITGYLFRSQMLRVHSRPDYLRLYVGRLFRVLPLYWFACVLVLAGVITRTGFHLREPPDQFVRELLKWAAGGYFGSVPINSDAAPPRFVARVTSTLHSE